ncbi:MAG TPA: nucleotide sugar dehydrogenase [Moraxellaceae bacterium]|nr:nucleotide sugar dehydrogenase [Moraxellaceae bacterium]
MTGTMRIAVHGDTHFAWVAAAKLAEKGHDVNLLLPSRESLAAFDPSRETGLPALLADQQAAGRLRVQRDGTLAATLHLMAADYTEETLRSALDPLIAAPESACVLVLTQLTVGALQRLRQEAAAASQGRVLLGALPLFIREGRALADFEQPELIVLGAEDDEVIACAKACLHPFLQQARKAMVVGLATAELIKFGVNAMLATRISFMNEMAALAEKLGVDIETVREGMAADSRVGSEYLLAGCGFGGPTFASELLSFARTMQEELDTAGLIDAVMAINDSQREILFRKIWRFFRGELKGRVVAVWGAAFKPGTSSVSNSVVHALLRALWAQGCRTRVYDPQAMDALRKIYPDEPLLDFSPSAEASAAGVDAVAIVTAWPEFPRSDFPALAQVMNQPVVFDGRNCLLPDVMHRHGFRYFGIGRGEAI